MDIFVISLLTAIDRRQHIERQFECKKIKYNFFDAISHFDIENVKQEFNLHLSNTSLTRGELGCLLSHVSIWQNIILKNLDYVAIFEDDIYLGEKIEPYLRNSNWIPQGVEIIKLEAFSETIDIHPFSKIKISNDRKIYALKDRHLGTAGYIISQNAAKKLLNYIQNLDDLHPIDDIMFDEFIRAEKLKVYQLLPALCIQDFIYNGNNCRLTSSLQSDRIKRQLAGELFQKPKLSLINKVHREVMRVFIQIFELHKNFYKRKMRFK